MTIYDEKPPKTLVGLPIDPKALREVVPPQSGNTLVGLPLPPRGADRGRERSVEVEVLHVEDRLSLDDRWSLEPAAAAPPELPREPSVRVEVLHVEDRLSLDDRWSLEPAASPEETPKPPPAAPATRRAEEAIAPAGVPRASATKLFVVALLAAAAAAAYVEQDRILDVIGSTAAPARTPERR